MIYLWSIVVLIVLASVPSEMLAAPQGKQDKDERSKKLSNEKDLENQQLVLKVMALSTDKTLQNELAMTDEQIKKVAPLGQKYLRTITGLSSKYKDEVQDAQKLFQAGKQAEGQELLQDMRDELSKSVNEIIEDVEDVLLPHQMKRIRQLSRQESTKLLNSKGDEFGTALALADRLGLSNKQKAALREATENVRKNYYKKIAKLKREAHRQILNRLTADQREKFKELIGDQYDKMIDPNPDK